MNDFDDLKKAVNELVTPNEETAKSNENIIEMMEVKRKQSFISSIVRKRHRDMIILAIGMVGLLLYQTYRGFGFTTLTFTLMELGMFLAFIQSFIKARILGHIQFSDSVISVKKTIDKYKKTAHISSVATLVLGALIVLSLLINDIVYSWYIVIILCVALIVGFCFCVEASSQDKKEMEELTEIVS